MIDVYGEKRRKEKSKVENVKDVKVRMTRSRAEWRKSGELLR
jgi:hypothetical protein